MNQAEVESDQTERNEDLKKRILAVILAGALFTGISIGSYPVYAKAPQLTFNYGAATDEEYIVLKELLEDYTELTGIAVETVSREADVSVGSFSEMEKTYKKGQLCNLYPYMEKESPYSDSAAWGEELPDEIRDRLQVYKREIPGYPAARTVARIFCNEELFEKAGVELPGTWSEFMEVCEKFKEQGLSPFAFPESDAEDSAWQWLMKSLCNQMDSNLADLLDETEDRYVELAEACKGVDKGMLDFTQPQIQAALGCMKEFYNSCLQREKKLNTEESLEIFAGGNAAMVLAVNEDMERLEGDFSWRAVPIPVVTEDTSVYAAGTNVLAGGEAIRFYGVNASLIGNEEMLNAAVDFIRYMTSVEAQEKMAAEAGLLPSAKNAKLPEKMQDFQVAEEPLRMPYFTGLDEQNRNEIWECIGEYLTGKTELAALTEKLNQSCQTAAQRIREENGWTLVNNYGMPTTGECTKCEP